MTTQRRAMAHPAGRLERLFAVRLTLPTALAPVGLQARVGRLGRPRILILGALAAATVSTFALIALNAGGPADGAGAPASTIVMPASAMFTNLPASPSGLSLVIDLAGKGLLVGALLYLTLRVLRRVQGGAVGMGNARLVVLESRTLAPKASLHLVAVGDRRIVVGLTPGGMSALAELDAGELPEIERPTQSILPSAPAGILELLRRGGAR